MFEESWGGSSISQSDNQVSNPDDKVSVDWPAKIQTEEEIRRKRKINAENLRCPGFQHVRHRVWDCFI
jgi:hypothetical protein